MATSGALAVAQAHRLERAARLVEAHPQRVGRRRAGWRLRGPRRSAAPARRGCAPRARRVRRPGAGLAGVDDRAEQPAADRHEVAHPLGARAARSTARGRRARVLEREGEHGDPLADPERAQARLQVLGVEVAAERLGEQVADHVALQQFVAFVEQPRERALGDRDERQLVGDLEQREVALARGRHERRRDALVGEAGAEAERRRSRGRRAARGTRAAPSGPSSCSPVVSSISPPFSHGVGSGSSVLWTQRTCACAASRPLTSSSPSSPIRLSTVSSMTPSVRRPR